jgi:hypothetical protein
MTASIVSSPHLTSLSGDPECPLEPVAAHALWNRFFSALAAEVGEAAAQHVAASSGFPAGSPRAIPNCLDRVCLPGWRFRSDLEAEAAGMADVFEARPGRQPTQARPGSPEKLAVLADRLARGEDLWHAEDATLFAVPGERSARSPFYSFHTGKPLRESLVEDLIDLAEKVGS